MHSHVLAGWGRYPLLRLPLPSAGMRRLLASMMVLALTGPAAAASEPKIDDLKVVAHLDLGSAYPHGDVAVTGATALVGSGPCVPGPVTVVSLVDPRRPSVAASIELPAGTGALDVDATGDLAALALDPCTGGTGVVLADLSRPFEPATRAQYGSSAQSVAFAARRDGQRLALSAGAGIRVEDVADPANPSQRAVWTAPDRARCRDAQPFDEGQLAIVVCGNQVYELDLTSPSSPERVSAAAVSESATHAVGVLLSEGTRVLVSEDDALRVLELTEDGELREKAALRSPGNLAPAVPVASGQLAFVAWHADGLRVLDLASPDLPVIARFVPPGEGPDVVGVALLPNHVVVVDAGSGLWVVERPKEGSKESGSDDVKVLLAALGMGGLLMLVVVPKVAAVLARAGAAATAMRPAGARRAG